MEFAAYSTDEVDFNGIKCLLQRLWLKENIDLSGLANLLIEESTIASILKVLTLKSTIIRLSELEIDCHF